MCCEAAALTLTPAMLAPSEATAAAGAAAAALPLVLEAAAGVVWALGATGAAAGALLWSLTNSNLRVVDFCKPCENI